MSIEPTCNNCISFQTECTGHIDKSPCFEHVPRPDTEGLTTGGFSISVYENLKCKVCGAHASEFHRDGCEVGAMRKELKELRAKVGSFCVACCDECKHSNCRELCEKCNPPKRKAP